MKKVKQFETLIVEEVEEHSMDPSSEHGHNFYEIIYILAGEGHHHINRVSLPYHAGDLFLLSPEDEHFFDVVSSTRFAIVRFTDHYFTQKRHISNDESLVIRPEELMRNKILKETVLSFDGTCSSILRNTMENILSYKCKLDLSNSAIVFYQILTVLGMVREELSRLDANLTQELPMREHLLSYIHQHIYQPEHIQVKNIAEHFNIASNYFSTFFRRNFEMSYREYVHSYKLGLIEKRIATGEATLKKIAVEFGFTDESHLSKYFKQKKDINIAEYRKKVILL
jgi:AraC-like DNA-binding protein